jgi:peptidoglycan lytic transglycosylase G
MSSLGKWLGGAALLGLLMVLAVFQLAQRHMHAPLQLEQNESRYELSVGTSTRGLARDLAARGMIRSAWAFELTARREQLTNKFKAGEYALDPAMTADDLMRLFVSGAVFQNSFTIVEGWTFNQLLNQLKQAPGIHPQLAENLSHEALMQAIGYADRHPEGRFLPETYRYPSNTSAEQFLRRAADALNVQLHAAWQARDLDSAVKSADEALILASIIERETALATERVQISGVLNRRLQAGMRLQVDPTVIYGLGNKFDGNLTRRHLKTDTPYNTYTRAGLPPTPIALASAAAIQASVHPAAGEFLYYVARGDGSHQFSVTYHEHIKAVQKYQLANRK